MSFRPSVVAALVGLAWAGVLSGQQDPKNSCPSRGTALSAQQQMLLARRYAPVLRFAPGERYFPTVPYFMAWDGLDNNGSPGVDLSDLDEIAPRLRDTVYWDLVDDSYRRQFIGIEPADTTKPSLEARERAAVFFRVRDLCRGESNELKRFLRSDEQAWHRFNHELLDSLGDSLRFRVVEYYFYYVRDEGLEGHPQDIEFTYLFLPYRRELSSRGQINPTDNESGLQFRIVVGGGHSYRTPNNILVMGGDRAGRDTTLNILVELGGHSSAPDAPPHGSFISGLDVNWHVYDIWGTRDIQAVAGVGFDGPYQTSMTFPRDTADAVTLFPSTLSSAAVDSLKQMRVEQTQGSRPVEAASSAIPSPHGPCGRVSPKDPLSLTCSYLLLPVAPFEALSTALADTAATAIAATVAAVDRIQPMLGDWRYRGFDGVRDTLAAIRRMRDWNKAPWWEGKKHHYAIHRLQHGKQVIFQTSDVWPTLARSRHRIWEHEQFRGSPTQILKKHLYRPTIGEFTVSKWDWFDLLTYGLSNQPPRASQFHVGVVLPAIRFPTRLPGFLELQFGRYGRQLIKGEHRISYAAVWTTHYNSRLSWYFKGEFVQHRREILHDPSARDLNLGGGVSILASLGRKAGILGNLANTIRIRTGLVLNPQSNDELFSRTGWEIQLTFRQ
ncbi:MAG TPA: hypothetical protein VGP80_16265 [Gemmatimonadales bacterium]|jgi:hypothetical protein|nr:hypothetical protein [Gemmatimonadales bacterium]